MSEYQYYEFLAVDRPLSDKQIEAVRRYSSRAEITSTRFVNEYHWGDFRGNVREFLKRFFDVFVYFANWGTHRFAFRAPAELIDLKTAKTYATEDGLSIQTAGEQVIFDFCSDTEDAEDWVEGGGWMASLAPVREEVLSGDFRSLYLAWLGAAHTTSLDDNDIEPPLPPGLGDLSAPQRALTEFIRLDDDLLTVASQASPPASAGADGLAEWVAILPEAEKNDLLVRLCEGGNPNIGASLLRRFRASGTTPLNHGTEQARRTVGELLEAAKTLTEKRRQEEARRRAEERARAEAKAAEVRAAYLADLAGREPSVWKEVESLIATMQPKNYDQAVGLLRDLRDVAVQLSTEAKFSAHLANLQSRHVKKPSLIGRLTKAGLTFKTRSPS